MPGDDSPDGLAIALRALIDKSGASAGAVCLLDAGDQTLRLVHEVGLSDEGCRQLRKIGSSDSSTWSVPLDGLIERRIRVYERANGDDLPPLLEPRSSMSAVACLPVLVDEQPRASVVLVALAPATFDVDALDDLAPALQEVAHILGTIGRPGADATPALNRDKTSAESGGLAARARELLESLLRPSAEGAASAKTGTGATDEIVGTQSDELLDGREAAERGHEAELGHLTARLAEAERQWAHEHSLRIEQQHRFELARTHADAERDETVRRALLLIETTDTLRSSAVAEAEALRNELAGAERLSLAAQDEARRARARAEASEATAAAAREESEQLSRALDDARGAATAAASRRSELEAELRALAGREGATRAREAEAEGRWQTTLRETQRALASAEQRAGETERQRAALAARLDEAVAREQQLRDERNEVLARSATEREDILHHALEVEREADQARVAAMAELETLRTAFGEAQKLILDAENRTAPEHEALLRYAAEAHEQLAAARAAAAAELESVRAQLAVAQAEVLTARCDAQRARDAASELVRDCGATRADNQQLAHALEEARASQAVPLARIAELEEDIRSLRDESIRTAVAARGREAESEAAWVARTNELESGCVAARDRAADLERDLVRHRDALNEARAREERGRELLAVITEDREGVLARATELATTAEEARARAAAEAETLRASLTSAQALIFQAEESARRARAEAEQHAEEARASLAERERLSQALKDAHAAAGQELAPAARPAPAMRESSVKGLVVAIVDCDDTFAASPPQGVRVEVLAPGADLPQRIARLEPARVLVNLASPGGLEAIGTLRAAAFCGRIWGCLTAPGLETVLLLGPVETTGRELDAETVLALLNGYATRGTRILSVGTSAGNLLSLRQALTRAGMSVSIAWDAKQATDLLAIVRPQVVILDLELPPRSGHGIVADLVGLEPPPLAVLIPGRDGDGAAAFAAALATALAEPAHRRSAMRHPRVLETLVRCPEPMPPTARP